MTVKRYPLHRVLALVLDEMARLHKHPSRSAGGVDDDAMIGLDDVDDGLDDRWRGKELAVVVCALLGELREEVFVDTAKHIARGSTQRLRMEGPHHLFQNIVLEALVVLRKLARERREIVFNGFHGSGHGGTESAVLCHLEQNVIASHFGQHQCTTPCKIVLDQRALRHPVCSYVLFDRSHRLVVTVCRVPQKNQAQYGHEILIRGEV